MRELPVALRWKVRQSRGGQVTAGWQWHGAVVVGQASVVAVAETACEASRRRRW
jgi:hypothetical protein